MRRIFGLILTAAVLLALPGAAACAAPATPGVIPSVSAPCAVLMEKATGEVLYEKEAHTRCLPASVTKVMTLLLIAEDIEAGTLSLDDTVTASARAASFGGSCVYLAEGERMSVRDMIKCIAVVSANDCAVAMAEHISGSEELFVQRMNQRAAELGLEDTHFTNCTGLFDDEQHYTSPYDVAVMSRELLRHEFIKDYTTIWMDSIRNGQFGLSSTNRLVYWYSGCTGLKTGFTSAAKYCISATAERDGVEYIAVIMRAESADSRNADARALLDYAFANYALCPLRTDAPLPEVSVELGRAAHVETELTGPEYALVRKTGAQPEYSMTVESAVPAPVHAGDRLGVMTVSIGGTAVAEVPVVAADDVPRLGFLGLAGLLGGRMLGL